MANLEVPRAEPTGSRDWDRDGRVRAELIGFLREADSAFGQVEENVQVSFRITAEARRSLEEIGYKFNLTKKHFVSAGLALWIRQLEKLHGAPVPTSRLDVSGMLPSSALAIQETILGFSNEPCVSMNAWIPRVYDAKLCNILFMLAGAGVRSSKRIVLGSVTLRFLDQFKDRMERVLAPYRQGVGKS